MSDNTCDNCGTEVEELYHNEASGLSYCDACDVASEDEDEVEAEGIHAEIRALLDANRSPVLALSLPPEMVTQAEELLALPEESLAALVEAARLMVIGASAGR